VFGDSFHEFGEVVAGELGSKPVTPTANPTESDATVVAQEPPADVVVSHGDTVGLRTALVTPEICDALHRLPGFSDGARWDLPLDTLAEIANVAGPARSTTTPSSSSTTSQAATTRQPPRPRLRA
jgi:hypothetical protein